MRAADGPSRRDTARRRSQTVTSTGGMGTATTATACRQGSPLERHGDGVAAVQAVHPVNSKYSRCCISRAELEKEQHEVVLSGSSVRLLVILVVRTRGGGDGA
jgi:hypothetical protein